MATKYVESVIGPRIGSQPGAAVVLLGDPVYWDSGNSRWDQADATDHQKLPRFVCVGKASFMADGDAGLTLALGAILVDSDAPYTVGGLQYLSETAGAITETRPTTAGVVGIELGRAITTDTAFIQVGAQPEGGGGTLEAGTAGVPALTFESDPDTGIYRVSANVMGIAVGGARTAEFSATGVMLIDNDAVELGTGRDSRIYYDESDTFWDLRATGAGDLMIALDGSFPSPDGGVHIWDGTAGSVTASTNADQLIVESSGEGGISILTPAGNTGILYFGDAASNIAGYLQYNHAATRFQFGTEGSTRLNYSAGAFAFQEATTISTSANALTLTPTTDVIVSTGQLELNDAIRFDTAVSDPSGSLTAIWNRSAAAGRMGFNVPSGDEFNFFINATEIMSLTASTMNFTTAHSITTSAGALTLNPTTDVIVPDTKGMVVGHTAGAGDDNLGSAEFQVIGRGTADTQIKIAGFITGTPGSVSGTGPMLYFLQSRHEAAVSGSFTIAVDGDTIGSIVFHVDDGTDYNSEAASIKAVIDGDISANTTPGALIFSVAASGNSVTEAVRLKPTGAMAWKISAASAPVDNEVSFGGVDISSERVLALSSEREEEADVDETKFSHKLKVQINGNTRYLMLTST
jgi:hypothetical protein